MKGMTKDERRSGIAAAADRRNAADRRLSYDPERLRRDGVALHSVGDRLDIGMSPEEARRQALLARRRAGTLATHCAEGLEQVYGADQALGTQLGGEATAAALREGTAQEVVLETIKSGAERIEVKAQAIHAVTGAELGFLCDRVLDRAIYKLTREDLPKEVREPLLISAGPMFGAYLLQQEVEAKIKGKRDKSRDGAQQDLSAAESEALVAQVWYALKNDQPVPDEDLLRATTYYRQHLQEPAAPAAPLPTGPAGAGTATHAAPAHAPRASHKSRKNPR